LKPFIPNRAELLSARVRWEDEERVRWEDEERGRESDGEMGRLGEFLFLCSPFFLFPSSFFLLTKKWDTSLPLLGGLWVRHLSERFLNKQHRIYSG